jgi:hypothetical protein
MSTAFSIRKTSQFLSDRERVANRRQDAESIEEPDLADAEEQEIAELWAADTGNQGA